MKTQNTIATVIVAVGIVVVIAALAQTTFGYRHDDGVLNEGTLVDYRYDVIKRNHAAVAEIDGKMQVVSTWRISYIDANGKFGSCHYYTKQMTNRPELNKHVKCSEQPLSFN